MEHADLAGARRRRSVGVAPVAGRDVARSTSGRSLKISLCFYLAGLALLIVTGVVVWLLADASGGIRNFEKFMGDILSAKNFHLVSPQILVGSVLVGLVLVALMSILTVIAAALYNVFAELVGGIEVTLVETRLAVAVAVRGRLGPGAAAAGIVSLPGGYSSVG